MSKILGTNVASAVVPFTTDDRYPTHFSKYGNGGWVEVATIEERNAIHKERRAKGMAALVEETGKLYILRGGIENSNWVEFSSGKSETYKHRQTALSSVWTVVHNLGKFPSVTVVDSSGTKVYGEVEYINENSLNILFSEAFTGIAYLN